MGLYLWNDREEVTCTWPASITLHALYDRSVYVCLPTMGLAISGCVWMQWEEYLQQDIGESVSSLHISSVWQALTAIT